LKAMGLVKWYLVIYNALQVAGWSYILVNLALNFAEGKSPQEGWKKIEYALLIFQNAAILEVIHALLGFVKTPITTTVMQVASRVLLTAVTYSVPQVQKEIFSSLMVGSWSLTEVIRYLYYALNQFNYTPGFLQFARYSAFLVLYPSGITGELGVMYKSLPYFQESGLWSIGGVSFYYILLAIMATYIPGSPYMYTHMLAQRRKYLGGHTKEGASTKDSIKPKLKKVQ